MTVQKLIENGGWLPIEEAPQNEEQRGKTLMLKSSQNIIAIGYLTTNRLNNYIWRASGSGGQFPATHYMPLDTPEKLAKIVGVLLDGYSTVEKHFPETKVLIKKITQQAEKIAGENV